MSFAYCHAKYFLSLARNAIVAHVRPVSVVLVPTRFQLGEILVLCGLGFLTQCCFSLCALGALSSEAAAVEFAPDGGDDEALTGAVPVMEAMKPAVSSGVASDRPVAAAAYSRLLPGALLVRDLVACVAFAGGWLWPWISS